MRHSIYHSITTAFFLLAGLQSCSFEGPLEPDFHNSDEGISLTFTNDPMLPYKVTTKALDVAADSKDEEEKRINTFRATQTTTRRRPEAIMLREDRRLSLKYPRLTRMVKAFSTTWMRMAKR